jgi:hypothetical protein
MCVCGGGGGGGQRLCDKFKIKIRLMLNYDESLDQIKRAENTNGQDNFYENFSFEHMADYTQHNDVHHNQF